MASENEILSKKMKTSMEETEIAEGDGMDKQETGASEEMELRIAQIHERIERYMEKVCALLESGKAKFKELSDDFEAKLILIHKEQIEKWQEEIKELRKLDAENVESNAVLHKARCLLQNPFIEC